MARDGKEQRIREVERCIEIWKENQWKHSADEAFFHYSQSMIEAGKQAKYFDESGELE